MEQIYGLGVPSLSQMKICSTINVLCSYLLEILNFRMNKVVYTHE